MAFHIRDPETDTLVRELARRKGLGLTEAVRLAVRNQLKTEAEQVPLRDRLRAIADVIAAYPDQDTRTDKEFFDELSGD